MVKIDKVGTTEVGNSENRDEEAPKMKVIVRKEVAGEEEREKWDNEESNEKMIKKEYNPSPMMSSDRMSMLGKAAHLGDYGKVDNRRASTRKGAAKSLIYSKKTTSPQDLMGSFVLSVQPARILPAAADRDSHLHD